MPVSTDITISRIEAAAPDQASLNAARKLLNPAKWPARERDAEGTLIWGACQGSGASAYRVAVEVSDLGAKCSCPSRKFPCKHAIALMWFFADGGDDFAVAEVPEWVTEWQGRRRRTAPSGEADPKASEPKSVAATETKSKPKDPEQAKRQRERVRKAREKSILQGLEEMDTWIGDQLHRGFGAFGPQATEQCQLMAQRLVDAKAGGLAGIVEQLPAKYFKATDAHRYDVLLETLGALHLLAEAYRRQAELDAPLVADIRNLVGWTVTREALLADNEAEHLQADWTVISTRHESQADRLVRFETFLATVDGHGSLRFALLLDFVPAATASSAGPGLEAGSQLSAELVYYPSSTPLRAVIVSQEALQPARGLPKPRHTLADALSRYDAQLATNPWLPAWPMGFRGCDVVRQGPNFWAVDPQTDTGVRLHGEQTEVLYGLDGVELFGTFDGRALSVLGANSSLGPLWNAS
ncbi:MAG: SWIM zinc finger family protein [Pseudomonadota bacterium]